MSCDTNPGFIASLTGRKAIKLKQKFGVSAGFGSVSGYGRFLETIFGAFQVYNSWEVISPCYSFKDASFGITQHGIGGANGEHNTTLVGEMEFDTSQVVPLLWVRFTDVYKCHNETTSSS